MIEDPQTLNAPELHQKTPLWLSLGLGGCMCLLLAYLFAFTQHQTQYAYSTTQDQPIRYAHTPSIALTTLARWATAAVTTAYTANFFKLNGQLEEISRYFTSSGFSTYRETMQPWLDQITANKWDVVTISERPGFIAQEGVDPLSGQKAWMAIINLLVTTTTAGQEPKVEKRTIGVTLNQGHSGNNDYGIGISDFQIIPETFLDSFK